MSTLDPNNLDNLDTCKRNINNLRHTLIRCQTQIKDKNYTIDSLVSENEKKFMMLIVALIVIVLLLISMAIMYFRK